MSGSVTVGVARWFVLLAAVALSGGCTFDDSELRHLTCSSDGDCVGGATCVAGFCVGTDDVLVDLQPPPDCGDVSCGSGAVCCEGLCVDTDADPLHCGRCGASCRPGEACTQGACACGEAGACDEVQSCCDGACVNALFNPRHCGGCGTVCSALPLCVSGSCSCGSGQWECAAGACTAILADDENCGACGEACLNNTTCTGAVCSCGGDACATGEDCCTVRDQVVCVDTSASPTHCGGCSTDTTSLRCKPRETCAGGSCSCNDGPACGPGEQCCPDGCEVRCDCGGAECLEGWGCCDDGGGVACKDVDSDPAHCGGCGVACRADQQCVAGNCVCPSGQTDCGGACVDVRADMLHCGRCGNACAGNTCCSGVCVDTTSDAGNCGGCGAACFGGAACVGSQCDCGAGPVNLQADPENCGACGRSCASGTCSAGQCDCGSGPVDLQSDENHCGDCGVTCGPTGTCTGGQCDCGAGPVDVRSDPAHCGRCGRSCGTADCSDGLCDCGSGAPLGTDENCAACGDSCGSGTCVAMQCTCSGVTVDLASDPANCGDCAMACPVDAQCESSACTCVGAGGVAVAFDTDEAHCGDCATQCPSASTCLAGECACAGVPVSFQTDPSHCGDCGVSCARPNATVPCAAGSCNFAGATCATSFGDCNANLASDGCETSLQTSTLHCGGCNQPCGDGETCTQGLCERVTISVSAGGKHACLLERVDVGGVFQSSEVWCWGKNGAGQFGDGTTNDASTAVRVDIAGSPLRGVVVHLSAGSEHTCFVVASGAVYCAGLNDVGQLGDDQVGSQVEPLLVPAVSGAIKVGAGTNHACALLGTGEVMCWGHNNEGQIGNGATRNGFQGPVLALVVDDAVDLSSGDGVNCVVTSAGAVQCWGRNNRKQAGDPSATVVSTPQAVSGLTGARQVACGLEHTCALLDSGKVQCWGRNDQTQLGRTQTGETATPGDALNADGTPIGDAVWLTAGTKSNCIVRDTGTEQQGWCWGLNDDGQLGDGTKDDRARPVRAGTIVNFRQLDGGIADTDFTCGVRRTQMSCWGANGDKQLGDGTSSERTSPVSWAIP